MTEVPEQAPPPGTGQVRTFLIADVRGYTRFTAERGDEAAAGLAARFATLARRIVSAYGGEVIDRPASQHDCVAGEPSAALGEPEGRDLPIGSYLGSLPANRVVGRGAELARASRLIDTVRDGRGKGKLLLLVGEPGAGKTRLAQEITLNLRNRDFLIAAGRCYEPQQAVPFYPFVEALTALYASVPPEDRHVAPRTWGGLAYLLPGLGLPVADYAGPPDQQRLFWTVTGLVQALARTVPVALLLDDLHWADATSLLLLQHPARHTDRDRVLLLGTYRDVEVNRRHPLEAALRDLHREGLVERIEVRRLGRYETRELIAALMGEEEISEEFTDLLYRRTEGNPFFVQQVLHALVDRGDVFRQDGHWDRKRIDALSVPEGVRSVVGQRLSRLTEETQEVLREASVLGQVFTFDDLQEMTGRAEAELERRLSRLSQRYIQSCANPAEHIAASLPYPERPEHVRVLLGLLLELSGSNHNDTEAPIFQRLSHLHVSLLLALRRVGRTIHKDAGSR